MNKKFTLGTMPQSFSSFLFFTVFIILAVPLVSSAATAGTTGAGSGGDEGTPTNGGGSYSSSTSWISATSTTWIVPTNVPEIKVKVWGAGGGGGESTTPNSGGNGGGGGYAEGVISVTPGQILQIDVGAGGGGSGTSTRTIAEGGALTRVASGTANWIVAGSGGGAGDAANDADGGDGGAGGGTTGYGGTGGEEGNGSTDNGGDGGGAGTQSSGGAAGFTSATAGSFENGGTGDTDVAAGGGNGGAGYYGGGGSEAGEAGGGAGGGGGGGSSYVISLATATSTEGANGTTSANSIDSDYISGAGSGGSKGTQGVPSDYYGRDGGDGMIVIWWSADFSPPEPDPSTFSVAPAAVSTSSITMTATTATDDNGVEYYFSTVTGTCGSDLGAGSSDSGWQESPTYLDTGLSSNKCYSYTVTTRDIYNNLSTATPSNDIYTLAEIPGTPINSAENSYTTIGILNDESNNPSSNPTTDFAVYVTTVPTDATWNGKYVDSSSNPSGTVQWLTDAQVDAINISGLNEKTNYIITIKARNGDSIETSYSQPLTTRLYPAEKDNYIRINSGTTIQPGNENIILQ